MAALRDGTRDLHEHTDAAIREGGWLTSRASYVGFLRRSLEFHRMVEPMVRRHVTGLGVDGWEWCPRSPFLEADLAAVGSPVGGIEADTASDAVVSNFVEGPASAVGVLYVVEGSTLGGRLLAGWIRSRLGYDASCGASSFVPYGADTLTRWQTFGRLAERSAQARKGDVATMVSAARSTFELHATVIGSAAIGSAARAFQTAGG